MKRCKFYRFFALFLSIVLLICLFPAVNVADAEELIDTEISATATVEQLTAGTKILDYIDEDVFASNNHVERLEEEETLSSYVFLNNDGTKTVYYTYQEVKYQAEDGTMVEKDISLVNTTNGYTTASNDVGLTLPSNPASGIGISYAGYDVVLTPLGGALRRPAQSNGTALLYPNYFGEGASLMYTPTLDGVKEDIVLTHYTGINTFSFHLQTNGLNLYLGSNRYYLAKSKDAEMRIEMGDIVSFDAHGKFSVGTMTAQTVTAGEEYILTLTVDEAFLLDENTTYPVAIDPTLTLEDETYDASGIEDVTIYSGRPNVNGNWTYLHCGYYDDTYQVARTLIRLPGLYNDNLYRGASPSAIDSAYFYIYEATGTAGQTITLHQNNGSSTWTESSVTWANAEDLAGSRVFASASAVNSTYTEFDITNLLHCWKLEPLLQTFAGFILKSTNETSVDKAFYSAEYSTTAYRPYVVVTYTDDSDPMPTSGYEKNFDETVGETNLWKGVENCIELMCNCYSYALNNQVHPDWENSIWLEQQPRRYVSTCSYNTTEALIFTNVTADYNRFRVNFNKPAAFAFLRIGQYTVCPSGMYKVALVMAGAGDYHWYRQDANGMWSHKNGSSPATDLDYSSNEISDPWIADRGRFVNFLGYYAVYPWDLLWSESDSIVCYLGPGEEMVEFNIALGRMNADIPSMPHCRE